MKVNAMPVQFPLPSTTAQKRNLDNTQQTTFQQATTAAATSTATSTTKTTAADTATAGAPLQAYAIPSWMSGFYVSLNPVDQTTDPKSEAFAAASTSDMSEYLERLQTHMSDAFEKNGVSDMMTRYNALKAIPGLNERLYDDFRTSVNSDSRLLGLMNKLGVSLA